MLPINLDVKIYSDSVLNADLEYKILGPNNLLVEDTPSFYISTSHRFYIVNFYVSLIRFPVILT